jgi:hypothetical protein
VKKLISIFLLFIILIADCKKSNNQPTLNFSDLPFKQGNSWTYSRYDQSVNVRDTVNISIPAIYTQNNTTTYLWVQTVAGVKDTAYWVLNHDTMSGLSGSVPIAIFNEIVFPISNGSIWGYQTDNSDSCTTVNQLKVNNISYNNLYQIHYFSPIFQDVPFIQNMYLVKGIGIVRYNQNQSPAATTMYGNLAITNYQWDLFSYHLN